LTKPSWRVRLSGPAQADVREIYRWTIGRFGVAQADAYLSLIDAALDALREGPEILGVRARSEIAPGLYTFHVGRGRRRGRHLVLFRVGEQGGRPLIAVGRILHDSMDIASHIPTDDDE
jgi:toxin ParE1/3/4